MGVTHETHQGEGGEQGGSVDALAFRLGAAQISGVRLRENEIVFAYLDDVYATC